MKRIGKIFVLGFLCCCIGEIESIGAMNLETESPMSGVSVALNNYYASRINPQQEIVEDLALEKIVSTTKPEVIEVIAEAPVTETVTAVSRYENIAVSQVSGYVNVRQDANTSSAVVGKIYNDCAATILSTIEGEGGNWYQIQSGNVNGYIKAQYFITGKAAEEKAKQVGTVYATVNSTNSLRLREEPNLESKTLTLLAEGAHYVVIEEKDDFVKLAIDNDLVGYVFKDYVTTDVEFENAVLLSEEEERIAIETKRKKEAEEAIKALEAVKKEEGTKQSSAKETTKATKETTAAKAETKPKVKETTAAATIDANPSEGSQAVVGAAPTQAAADVISEAPPKESATAADKSPGGSSSAPPNPGSSSAVTSATRNAVVAYAKQFIGNPYVYGGTSLTNGADCSGYTQSIFSNFGLSVGRSSRDQAAKGREIAVDAVQPGDLLFYASGNYINHVAIYIGGGQVVHASNATTGITTSPANYRTPCKAVTFLD